MRKFSPKLPKRLVKKMVLLFRHSTTDIYTDKNEHCCENMDTNSQADKLTSGYGQTKWLAERIVFKASQEGLPTIITRYLRKMRKNFTNLTNLSNQMGD